MGSSATAACDCGFTAEVMIGGGILSFHDTCLFPAICQECHQMVEVNLLARPLACLSCGSQEVQPYNLPALCGETSEVTAEDWWLGDDGRRVRLTDGTYLCPSCGKFTLRFTEGGILWD